MECNLYEAVEKFELVDVDNVILTKPLEIREPSSFGDIKIILSRNIDDRGGANFEFGEAETTLGFDRYCGYNEILDIINLTGSDSNIVLNYYREEGGVFINKYKGSIVISSMSEEDDEMRFRVKREDFGEKLRTRYEIDQPIETPFDLDGNEISEIDLVQVGLHSKALDLKYDVINETNEEPAGYDRTIITGSGGDGQNTYFLSAITQFGASKTNINTIGDVLTSIDYGTRIFAPPSGTVSDTEDYLRDSLLYNFKCLKTGRFTFNLFIKAQLQLSLTSSNNPRLTYYLAFEIMNPNGTQEMFLKLVPDQVFEGGGSVGGTVDIDINEALELDLEDGWNIYIYGIIKYFNVSGSAFPDTLVADYELDLESLYFGINKQDLVNPSLVKGLFIYEALNRLIQKSVGNSVRQATIAYISSDPFIVGEKVIGVTSNSYGYVHSTSTLSGFKQATLVGINGGFITGEEIVNELNTKSVNLSFLDAGKMLSSSLLERVENGAEEDGVGSLNLVTNGFAIRGFLNEDYDTDVFYKKGDNVTYNKLDYTYINEDVTRGNLPTDEDYWIVQKGRKISTSIKKLVDFVKFRFGAGFAIIQQEGLGYGELTDEKITKVIIEKHDHFFRDEEIIQLNGVENPIVRKLNKDILFNTIELGYKLFSKENEQASISGFNTDRRYLTPIKKDKSNLSLMCDVCTDGYEIERLRRLTQSENPNEADEKDEETFIIKLRRVDGSETVLYTSEINPALYVDNVFDLESYRIYSEFNEDTNEIYIYGILITGIEAGDTIRYQFDGDYFISSARLEPDNNRTVLKVAIFESKFLYERFHFLGAADSYKNIFVTEIIEGNDEFFGAKNVLGSNDPYSEYNLDHTPTKFLMNNYGWFGGSMKTKSNDDLIRFTSGSNNVFLRTSELERKEEITTDKISENQDFTLLSLRGWSPEIFNESEYELNANFSYSDLEKIRLAMTGEAEENNFGYITFTDNQGELKKGFPIKLTYKALDNTATLTLWGKS